MQKKEITTISKYGNILHDKEFTISKYGNILYNNFVIDTRLKCVIGKEDENGIVKKLSIEDIEYCKNNCISYMDLGNFN